MPGFASHPYVSIKPPCYDKCTAALKKADLQMKGYSRLMRSKKDNVVVAFMKKETVPCAAAALAVISMFAVPPDQEYEIGRAHV